MKRFWLTYAWVDNTERDVDFIIQQLDPLPIDLKFDRRSIVPGQRLWDQIGNIILNPSECDAWGIVLTPSSLRSQSCVEELSYALDRALRAQGGEFPMFALLHGIDPTAIPPALRVRLCISLSEPDWTDRVLAAVNGVAPGYSPREVSPYIVNGYGYPNGRCVLEIRPRIDRINPFVVAIPLAEKISRDVRDCLPFTAGQPPMGEIVPVDGQRTGAGYLGDGTQIWQWQTASEASPSRSYYLMCGELPSKVWVGPSGRLRLVDLSDPDPF